MLFSPIIQVLLWLNKSVIVNITLKEATYYLVGQERSIYKLKLPSFLNKLIISWVSRLP